MFGNSNEKLVKSLAKMTELADTLSKSLGGEAEVDLNKSETPEQAKKEAPEEKKDAEMAQKLADHEKKEAEEEKKEAEDMKKSVEASTSSQIAGKAEADGDLKVKDEKEVEKAVGCGTASNGTDLQKSMSGTEAGQDAFEVSEFLEQLVKSISDVMGAFDVKLQKSMTSTDAANEIIAKSFGVMTTTQSELAKSCNGLQDLLKSMGSQVEALETKINDMEMSPVMKKSVTNLKDLDVTPKNFAKSLGDGSQQLSKSDTMAILNNLCVKGDTVIPLDIISYESGAPLRDEVVARLNQVQNN